MNVEELLRQIQLTFECRKDWFDPQHWSAFRLFNGFIEGFPDIAVDLYARTLVLYNFAKPPDAIQDQIETIIRFYCDHLPWIQAVIVKIRHTTVLSERHGILLRGEKPDTRTREHGIWYALDLQMSSDASLYLDTRELRAWIKRNARGLRVLNTFTYTGSLGVASTAGGARQVIHLDRNRKFLNLAKTSYSLNGFPINRADFVCEDFFRWTSRMRRARQRFDLVILDPPFFSLTSAGRVDLNKEYDRLINKARPLVESGGILIVINNALYVSGSSFIRQLETLCQDGYMTIEELIPIPPDFAGFPETRIGTFPTDPAPFNHPTKIAVLRIRSFPPTKV